MAQRYIPEITQGDKRVLLVDGVPVEHGLARIPTGADGRGNLALGARGKVFALSERDRAIANALGPVLAAQGLWFVGLDIIGEYLTEINVTSPTCVREVEAATGLPIADNLIAALEKKVSR